jgi:putative peptidoglycan lipid II flippase
VNRSPGALRSAVVVSGVRALSVLLALVGGVLSARYFGTSAAKDCYVVAAAIPNLVTTLLFGGLSSSALVTLIEIGAEKGTAEQLAFVRRILRQLTLGLLPVLVFGGLWPEAIVPPFAPGFDHHRIALAARLLRLTLLAAILNLVCLVLRCLFESRGRYATSYLLYLTLPLGSLLVLVLFADRIGVYALAVGSLPGLLLAVPLLWMIAATFRDSTPVAAVSRPPGSEGGHERRFWMMLGPMSLAANLGQFNLLIDNAFASALSSGSITMMGFALSIVTQAELPTSLSLAEVAFWRLTSAAQRGPGELGVALRSSLRQMILLTAPLCGGAMVFGAPLARLLFERGQFGPDATAGVSALLACYGPEIVFSGYAVLLARVLFARHRLRTVVTASLAAMAANLVLDALLMRWLGMIGIAIATTLVALLHALILVPAVRREVTGIRLRDEGVYLCRVLGGASAMAAAVWLFRILFERLVGAAGDAVRLAEVAVGIGLGGGVFLGALRVLGVTEAEALFRRILVAVTGLPQK